MLAHGTELIVAPFVAKIPVQFRLWINGAPRSSLEKTPGLGKNCRSKENYLYLNWLIFAFTKTPYGVFVLFPPVIRKNSFSMEWVSWTEIPCFLARSKKTNFAKGMLKFNIVCPANKLGRNDEKQLSCKMWPTGSTSKMVEWMWYLWYMWAQLERDIFYCM